MNGKIVLRIVAALVLIAAIAGIAFFAFNAGLAQNVAQSVQLTAGESGNVPYSYYGMHHGHFFPFFGFGCFGLLIPLFLLCVALGALRRLFWGGPHWGFMHQHGPWGKGPDEGVSPMFREWHRRAHEAPAGDEESTGETPKK